MKVATRSNHLVGVRIRRLSIQADSRIDARRLADALPGRLLRRLERGPAPAQRGTQGDWDDVTDQLAEAIEAELERHHG